MPHSSGGGSSSGGGGSHGRSNGGWRGGSGGFEDGSGKCLSFSYFPGARRFVRYNAQGPHFIYANYDITVPPNPPTLVSRILLVLVAIAVLFGSTLIMKGDKCVPYMTTETACIKDAAGVFTESEEKSLQKSMKNFYKQTHIPIEVVTVNNSLWQKSFSSLGNYAYKVYVNDFDDEYHWVLVYSQSEDTSSSNDWYWEGMQGDSTANVLSDDVLSTFNSSLQKRLTANNKHSVGTAFKLCIDEAVISIQEKHVKISTLLESVFFLFMGVMCGLCALPGGDKARQKYKKFKECPLPTNTEDAKCPCCGGVYVKGTVQTCPYCGALLSSDNRDK